MVYSRHLLKISAEFPAWCALGKLKVLTRTTAHGRDAGNN